MNAKRICEDCGSELPAQAPEGLCPQCLLRAGLPDLDASDTPAFTSPETLPAGLSGQRFGDYELIGLIASGGMGAVYEARQVRLNRIVAVKTLPFGRFTRESYVRRFRAEAEAAARLRHPNIVAIHEVGEHAGQLYFSMDYVDGSNLAEVAREQPLTVQRAVRLTRTIAEAVHYAHGQGILHRDLKPSNILVDALDQPHITDFGLAKDLNSGEDLTLTGETLGSPNYIPPEQIDGKRGVADPRSDIYSLGAVFYHLLTGRPPFVGESLSATLHQVASVDAVAPRLLNPTLPRDLETICLKCLEKEPGRRYTTALELAEELGRWQASEPIYARPVSRAERAWRWCHRQPALAASILVSSLLLLVVLVGFPVATYRIYRARAAAQITLERQQILLAEERFRRDETSEGIAYLGQVLRANPHHRLAADRLISALTYRHFALPVTPSLQHQGAVLDADFDPKGDRVVTASADGSAQVWDTRSGQRVGTRMDHPAFRSAPYSNRVWAVAFSPDGRRVATASANGSARLWDAQTGLPASDWLRHGSGPEGRDMPADDGVFHPGFAAHRAFSQVFPDRPGGAKTLSERRGATDVSFSPDGTQLVTTGDDGLARVWDTNTGQPIRSLAHGGLVWSARFSQDGRLLVTASWDLYAYVWESQTGHLVAKLPHNARVLTADFSPEADWLVTGERWSRARVWRRESDEWKWVYDLWADGEMLLARFTPDGQRIVVSSSTRRVRIYDAQTGREIHGHLELAAVNGGDLTSDGRWFAVATAGDDARIYDAATGNRVFEPLRCDASVTLARFSPNGSRLVTGDADGNARVWNLERQPRWETLRADTPSDILGHAVFSPDAALVCQFGSGGHAVLRSLPTGKVRHRLPHSGTLFAGAFSPDGQRVATGSDDHTVIVWRTADGQPAGPALVHPQEVKDLRFSADGRQLLTACVDGAARLWSTETFELLRSFRHSSDVRKVEFSLDGRSILTASDDFTAQVWNVSTGERTTPPLQHRDEVLWVEYSPAGDLIATASKDGTARVWNALTGSPLTAPLKHRSAVRFACFDPNGHVLATASEDRTVMLWNPRTGSPLTDPLMHEAAVEGIAFGPDGRWIASAAWNGSARFWDVTTGQPLSENLPSADQEIVASSDRLQILVTSRTPHLLPVPGAATPMPTWMLDVADAIAGQKRTSAGSERILPGELLRLREIHASPKGTDYYARWVSWFFADPAQRALTPGSDRTTHDYLESLREQATYESLREATEMAPNDGPILAKLAELEASQIPPNTMEARFHLRRALRIAPNHPQVREVQERLRIQRLDLGSER